MSDLENVSIATSQEEREAIYRFRYEVYVKELKRDYPDADHEREWLRDEDDERDYAVNFYMGPLDQITGAMRLLIWPAGAIPEDYFGLFSMEVFPGLESLVQIGYALQKCLLGLISLCHCFRHLRDRPPAPPQGIG